MALKREEAEGEVVRAGLASPGPQAEVHAIGALETDECERVDVRLANGTVCEVVLDGVCKDLIFILSSRDISIHPVFSLKVVLVLTVARVHQSSRVLRLQGRRGSGAVGSADLVDHLHDVLLLKD
jgi:hypothetical protein